MRSNVKDAAGSIAELAQQDMIVAVMTTLPIGASNKLHNRLSEAPGTCAT